MDYSKHADSRKATPQSRKVPGVARQKENYAGGVVFKMSKWDYLDRFLILGTEGGTFYVGERKLTKAALKNVAKCIKKDGVRVVDRAIEISKDGRSANNDAAIYAVAMCARCDDEAVRKYAFQNFHRVCRIGTHLFHFMNFVRGMRGMGTGLRRAIGRWYTKKNIDTLAFQLMKYKQRDGWSHSDVLKLARPKPEGKEQDKLFAYVTGNREKLPKVSDLCVGIRKLKGVSDKKRIAKLVTEYRLPREVIPTEHLNSVEVWEALLQDMPITATMRNLGKMSSLGMLSRLSDNTNKVVEILTDPERIKRGRVHPLNIMNALLVYGAGQGDRGSLRWERNSRITDALQEAFYASFKQVEPSGQNIMVALDVSGSMDGYKISGSQLMTCRIASAVMAMVTIRAEPNHMVTAFTAHGNGKAMHSSGGHWGGGAISEVALSPNKSLEDVATKLARFNFAGTDCSLPMLYATANKIPIDLFVVYTDNETWAGNIHPFQALEKFRDKMGIAAKLVVVGMVGSKFSIANPDDPGMLDVVGFDTHAPNAISEFATM